MATVLPRFSTLGLVPRHPAILLAAIVFSRERCATEPDHIAELTAASIVRDFRQIGLKSKRPDSARDPVGYVVELCNYLKTTLLYNMNPKSTRCVTLKQSSPLLGSTKSRWHTDINLELERNWLETIICEIQSVFPSDADRLRVLLPPSPPPPRYVSVAEAISIEKPIVTAYWNNRRAAMDHKRALAAARIVDVNRNRRFSVISTESEAESVFFHSRDRSVSPGSVSFRSGTRFSSPIFFSEESEAEAEDILNGTETENVDEQKIMSCNPRAPSASPPLEDQHMYTLQSKASQCQSTNIGTSNAFQLPLATDEVAGSSNISIIVSEDPIAESSKRKLAVEENVTGNSSKKRTTRQATSERGELVNEPERLSVAMDTLDGKYIFVPDFLSYGTRRGTFQSLIFTQRFDACCKSAQKAIEWAYSQHPLEKARFEKLQLRFHRVRKIRHVKNWNPKTYSDVYRAVRLGDTTLGVTEETQREWVEALQTLANGSATMSLRRLAEFKAELFSLSDDRRKTDIEIYKHLENFSLPEVCVALRTMSARNECLWYKEEDGVIMYL